MNSVGKYTSIEWFKKGYGTLESFGSQRLLLVIVFLLSIPAPSILITDMKLNYQSQDYLVLSAVVLCFIIWLLIVLTYSFLFICQLLPVSYEVLEVSSTEDKGFVCSDGRFVPYSFYTLPKNWLLRKIDVVFNSDYKPRTKSGKVFRDTYLNKLEDGAVYICINKFHSLIISAKVYIKVADEYIEVQD